jgi:hypothetical protein
LEGLFFAARSVSNDVSPSVRPLERLDIFPWATALNAILGVVQQCGPSSAFPPRSNPSEQILLLVSRPVDGGYAHQLTNDRVKSAFKVLAALPKLYDQIYADLPEAYNRAGGKFGGIGAVRMFDASKVKEKNPKYLKKQPQTPFFGFPVNYTVPDGFLVPLLYGLRALIKSERGTLSWRLDPSLFLKQNLNEIAKSYKLAIEMATFDPQARQEHQRLRFRRSSGQSSARQGSARRLAQ